MARIHHVEKPVSSFLSVDKDTDLIISKMLKNDRLKRLLYYPKKDCITNVSGECPNLTEEETLSLIGKQIRLVPRVALDEEVCNYIFINFNNFIPNRTNPHFRDNTIQFDIVCDFDQWYLADGQLRPYRIAAEIDSMFNGAKLSGIGKLDFAGAAHIPISDTKAGFALLYVAIHGDEDQKDMLSEQANAQFIEEFNQIWNSDDE